MKLGSRGVSSMGRGAAVAAGVLAMAGSARAQFASFQGDAATEAQWRAAAGGGVPLEDFEAYRGVPSPFSGPSDQVTTLPLLGVDFFGAEAGTFPGVYSNVSQAHSGANQLANFGGGGQAYSDYTIVPYCGLGIVALGFWQCDPQGDQTMYAYDASGALVGSITGLINSGQGNSFAGFVSATPIARVVVEGTLGDGWNHIDDLQIATTSVACSACDPDVNCDGVPDQDDVACMILAVAGDMRCFCQPDPDFNRDGVPDQGDVADVILTVAGAPCP